MTAAVVIPAWNGERFLPNCLSSVRRWTPAARIIVVDNGSTDNSAAIARELADRVIVHERNLGFSAAINTGIAACVTDADIEIVFLLNQDTRAESDWETPIARKFAADPKLGVVGCLLKYPDGSIQHAGAQLTEPYWETRHLLTIDEDARIDFVTGAALAIRRKAIDVIGDFDLGYQPAYYEDVDYCLRANRAGWRIGMAYDAVLTHFESQSRGEAQAFQANLFAQRLRTIAKHRGPVALRDIIEQHEVLRALYLPRESGSLRAHAAALDALASRDKTLAAVADDLRRLARLFGARADGAAPRDAFLGAGSSAGAAASACRALTAHARAENNAIEALLTTRERSPIFGHLWNDWFVVHMREQTAFNRALFATFDADGAWPSPPAPADALPDWNAFKRNITSGLEHALIRPGFKDIARVNAIFSTEPDDDAQFYASTAGGADYSLYTIANDTAVGTGLMANLRRANTPDALVTRIRAVFERQRAFFYWFAHALGQYNLARLNLSHLRE